MAIIIFPSGTGVSRLQFVLDNASDGDTILIEADNGPYIIGDATGKINNATDGDKPLKIRSKFVNLRGIGRVVFHTNKNTVSGILIKPDSGDNVSRSSISNITIEGAARSSAINASGIDIVDADNVSIIDVTIINFQAGIAFDMSATDAVNTGSRVINPRILQCDDGIRFRSQDQFQLKNLVAIDTGIYDNVDHPHAIYASGNVPTPTRLNRNIFVDNCLSINHRYDHTYKFKNGINTVSGLRAQRTGGLLLLDDGASGSFTDMTLLDWAPVETATDVCVNLSDTKSVTIDGVVARARDGESDLRGFKVSSVESGAITRISNFAIYANYSAAGFVPFLATNSPKTSFVCCAFYNLNAASVDDVVFNFQASPEGYVLSPAVKGSGKIIELITAGGISSTDFLASLNGKILPSTLYSVSPWSGGFREPSGTVSRVDRFFGDVTSPGGEAAVVEVDTGTSGGAVTVTLPSRNPFESGKFSIQRVTGTQELTLNKLGVAAAFAMLPSALDFVVAGFGPAGWVAGERQIGPLFETFDNPGITNTYVARPLATFLEVMAIGGGGSGASGRLGSGESTGGGGGGGGAIVAAEFLGAFGPVSPLTVTLAAEKAGGLARTSAADGDNGGTGNPTLFGGLLRAAGGAFGLGGTSASANGGTTDAALSTFGLAGPGGAAQLASLPNTGGLGLTGGGGPGGGVLAGDIKDGGDGGNGTATRVPNVAGGSGGDAGSDNDLAGDPATDFWVGIGGGGGGGGSASALLAGYDGADGGKPGGGGAGGGGGTTTRSGAGGKGAPGQVRVATFF